MPELPEVETTLRGVQPYLEGRRVSKVGVRNPNLRWPVPKTLGRCLHGREILLLRRRGKYLLLDFDIGSVLIHLGMSGSLRIVSHDAVAAAHDHVDIVLDSCDVLRFRDPRRFGCVLWANGDALQHPLLRHLGPEPLTAEFCGEDLFRKAAKRKTAVKNLLMDSQIVVGVGNIYASEALYRSAIHPRRAAGRIALPRYRLLATSVKHVLREAIEAGGTTLHDFRNGGGEPGYFKQALDVYDRQGQPCNRCGSAIRKTVIGQRASYYCPQCQR